MQNNKKENETQVSFYCDKELAAMFVRLYPGCRSRFLLNALKRATNDEKFFSDIFFMK